ncbi:unnamed protein product [Prunus armeniaca]
MAASTPKMEDSLHQKNLFPYDPNVLLNRDKMRCCQPMRPSPDENSLSQASGPQSDNAGKSALRSS